MCSICHAFIHSLLCISCKESGFAGRLLVEIQRATDEPQSGGRPRAFQSCLQRSLSCISRHPAMHEPTCWRDSLAAWMPCGAIMRRAQQAAGLLLWPLLSTRELASAPVLIISPDQHPVSALESEYGMNLKHHVPQFYAGGQPRTHACHYISTDSAQVNTNCATAISTPPFQPCVDSSLGR